MPIPEELAKQAEQLDDEQWYDFLDELDEVSRRRRQRTDVPSKPPSGNRDDVAAWVARTHFVADPSIREVWYLPGGAPTHEIRFLEVNEHLSGPGPKIEPVDFGLDIEGLDFRLVVADVTSDQLNQIKANPSLLPAGWSLDGKKVWGRRA
jgi:hypothetical protein